jgi:hypothetical protein
VLAEAALVIQVQTGGNAKEIKDIMVEDLVKDGTTLDAVAKSINGSDEVKHAVACMYEAAYKHKKKYPDTRVHITPCLNLKEAEEVTFTEDELNG